MAKGSKTTEFLKECMADALIMLMEKKSIEKISITEITELAGVGRSTWFRNFSAKSEALSYKLVSMWYRWAQEHGITRSDRFSLENAKDFFQFNCNIRDLLKTLYKAEMQNCIYDAFCTVMMPQYDDSPFECYQSRFYAHGLYGLLEEWAKRGFSETADEMFNIFFRVMDDRTGIEGASR